MYLLLQRWYLLLIMFLQLHELFKFFVQIFIWPSHQTAIWPPVVLFAFLYFVLLITSLCIWNTVIFRHLPLMEFTHFYNRLWFWHWNRNFLLIFILVYFHFKIPLSQPPSRNRRFRLHLWLYDIIIKNTLLLFIHLQYPSLW